MKKMNMTKNILFIFLPVLLWTACGTSEHPTSNSMTDSVPYMVEFDSKHNWCGTYCGAPHLEEEYSEDNMTYYLRITPDSIIIDHKYFQYLISSKKNKEGVLDLYWVKDLSSVWQYTTSIPDRESLTSEDSTYLGTLSIVEEGKRIKWNNLILLESAEYAKFRDSMYQCCWRFRNKIDSSAKKDWLGIYTGLVRYDEYGDEDEDEYKNEQEDEDGTEYETVERDEEKIEERKDMTPGGHWCVKLDLRDDSVFVFIDDKSISLDAVGNSDSISLWSTECWVGTQAFPDGAHCLSDFGVIYKQGDEYIWKGEYGKFYFDTHYPIILKKEE